MTLIRCTALISLSPYYTVAVTFLPKLSMYVQLTILIHPIYPFRSSKIYRCWIVWGYNIRVVILPSFLAFTYLGMSIYLGPLVDLDLLSLVIWMVFAGAVFRFGQVVIVRVWTDIFVLTALAISMIVNPLVTGLIVFRIFKVFRAVKGSTSSDEKSLGVTGGEKLRSIIFIIMESDMPLFAIQLARVVTTTFVSRDPQVETLSLVVGIHQMLNVIISSVIIFFLLITWTCQGITPTIILLRVSMGLSFHDEPSLIDAVSSLRFAADDSDPIPRTGIMSRDEPHDTNPISEMIGTREERRDDDIGRSDDIQTVDA